VRSLFDVNVLIALLDGDHQFHSRVHAWWASEADKSWASCPITENGVVRIMSGASYRQQQPYSAAEVIKRLSLFADSTNHEFWPDTLSICDKRVFDATEVYSRQLTDGYLLALAVGRNARLVTLDQTVRSKSVRAASGANLLVI
jgi:uncharacterized protein